MPHLVCISDGIEYVDMKMWLLYVFSMLESIIVDLYALKIIFITTSLMKFVL